MTTPSRAAAFPFSPPDHGNYNAGRDLQLLEDIAVIMKHHGMLQPSGPTMATARFTGGAKGCLSIVSTLEMPSDASDAERMERRWQTARLSVFVEKEGKKTKLFDAICSDREALANAHPSEGLAKIPFIPGEIRPGEWLYALGALGGGLRKLDELTAANAAAQPQPRRWHPT